MARAGGAGRPPLAQAGDLRRILDAQYAAFNVEDAAADPVQFLHRFTDPGDREVVGFVAAGLAFGRVASVLASVERVLEVMGTAPASFVRGFAPERDAARLQPLVHRWTRGPDLVALMIVLREMLARHGSIEGAFAAGHDRAAADVTAGLDAFSATACAVDVRQAYGRRPPAVRGVRYFFPRPSAGSGCKRLNLFLRWMVRRDAVDPGGWTRVRSSQLIVPLDTHVIRLGRCLRLTHYASPGWKMAAEITASLRELDPDDPVKYDFALCHLGMMKACGFATPLGSRHCPLNAWCRPGSRRSASSGEHR
jgi:uncharacterized protein (TIGR02757 family)